MIRFACRCGQTYDVANEMAGGDLQCTKCGLLNTVPTLTEVGQIDLDGGYKIDADAPTGTPSPERLATLHRAFTRNTTTTDGNEIDNRVTPEELAMAGDEIPLADDTLANARPRYDPISGELIRPLELAPRDVPRADEIPMAKPALTYAANTPRATTLTGAAALLTSPGSLAVLGIMFLLHVFMQGVMLVSLMFIFLAVFCLPFVFGVLGHFANVIDEIGPRDMDELPRPFRDLQLSEDLWLPFVHTVSAFGFAFGPAILIYKYVRLPEAAMIGVYAIALGIGALLLPALAITTSTSGTMLNLRPDRVWGVIKAGGASYVFLAIVGIVAMVFYFVGQAGVFLWLATKPGVGGYALWLRPVFSYPVLCLGIFLMHLFAWQCGLYYREHHAGFNWVYQRHVRLNKREDIAVKLARRPRRVQAQEPRPVARPTARDARW